MESPQERRARKAVEYQHDALEMMTRSKPGVGEGKSIQGFFLISHERTLNPSSFTI